MAIKVSEHSPASVEKYFEKNIWMAGFPIWQDKEIIGTLLENVKKATAWHIEQPKNI